MQMIFQNPSASLNPKRRVREMPAEVLSVHRIRESAAIGERLDALTELVGLRREYLDRYQHEFSGGQRQRIGDWLMVLHHPCLLTEIGYARVFRHEGWRCHLDRSSPGWCCNRIQSQLHHRERLLRRASVFR
ncbi:hypothetical protein E9677_22630 [Rhizobium rhizophilum]|uniref:Uncharacterized protein n=2 Tax=Rhizobium rhizophilum TaxID=1850373 RepID=A0ABY2QND9_9HYPH|nr:hypothetical protein E9677_22630 [Rhizobium rhizophilum]